MLMTQFKKLPWQNSKKPTNVLVVGDLILDEYIDGSVQRVSPEAPVPVHLVSKATYTAGGAGNVARNIKLSGGEVTLVGVCGKDEGGEQLKNILAADNISTDSIIVDSDRPTTKKTRIRASNQQLLRVDWEKVTPINQELQGKLLEAISNSKADAIILSDYGKGCMSDRFIQDVIELALKLKIPSIIDPKGTDFGKYKNGTYITPNRKESCDPLGIDHTLPIDPKSVGAELQKTFGLDNILMTLGAEGMYFHPSPSSKEKPVHLPAEAREVFDVSGAGDTVVAIFSLGIASGAKVEDAMNLANVAAGIVVEKLGTKPVTKSELESALFDGNRRTNSFNVPSAMKIHGIDNACTTLEKWREQQSKIVFTNGCFDILHAGHVTYLEKARQLGDKLIVGVNSDSSIKQLKGPSRPVNTAKDRKTVLAALSCIDMIVEFDELTPLELIKALKPDVLVKGKDYEEKDIVGGDFVKSQGGNVETIELVENLSTTSTIEKILAVRSDETK